MAIEGKEDVGSRQIRLGMVGGGRDAFIGAVHRIASRIDGHYRLVAGCLSSTPEKSKASGADLGLAEDRVYGDFDAMAKREARLKSGIEAVAIVTPNHLHYAAARPFLQRGIHVICDKPLTSTLADARKLVAAAERSDALFVLTHNYTGYPMVRQAREMVSSGEIGDIRVVQVEYPQDWLTEAIETTGAEAGVLANRSHAVWSRGLYWRHRHACIQPGLLCHRAEARGAFSRSADICHWSPCGRQRSCDAALRWWRTWHALVEPGCAG